MAEEQVFPRLAPHQRRLLVPGVYGNTPASCVANGGTTAACALDTQASQVVAKLDPHFAWAKADARIVGFNPWHFACRSSPHNRPRNDRRLGAAQMPSVLVKLREIGRYTIAAGLPPARCTRPLTGACSARHGRAPLSFFHIYRYMHRLYLGILASR